MNKKKFYPQSGNKPYNRINEVLWHEKDKGQCNFLTWREKHIGEIFPYNENFFKN